MPRHRVAASAHRATRSARSTAIHSTPLSAAVGFAVPALCSRPCLASAARRRGNRASAGWDAAHLSCCRPMRRQQQRCSRSSSSSKRRRSKQQQQSATRMRLQRVPNAMSSVRQGARRRQHPSSIRIFRPPSSHRGRIRREGSVSAACGTRPTRMMKRHPASRRLRRAPPRKRPAEFFTACTACLFLIHS